MALRAGDVLPPAPRIQSSAFYVQEVAVKVLRFRIATVLALIAIAAFDLAAIRTLVAYRDHMPLAQLNRMCDLLLERLTVA